MTLQTYLYRCKRENAQVLFWLLVNSLCLLLHGMFSSLALTSLVALKGKTFALYCLAIAANSLVWMVQIRRGAVAKERAIQRKDQEIRQDIVSQLEAASYADFHQEEVASYVSWLTNDVNNINDLGFETLEWMVT